MSQLIERIDCVVAYRLASVKMAAEDPCLLHKLELPSPRQLATLVILDARPCVTLMEALRQCACVVVSELRRPIIHMFQRTQQLRLNG